MSEEANVRDENLIELQQIVFGILRHFKELCGQLGLRYYLAYGTLIGAVRHHGFIPWDDDVDIWMPRKDYMILLDYLNKNEGERYSISNEKYRNVIEWPEEFQMKIIDKKIKVERWLNGECYTAFPWIDIFALDNAPEDRDSFVRKFHKKRNWYLLCWSKTMKYKAKGLRGIGNKIVYTLHNKFHLLNHTLNERKAAKRLFDTLTAYSGIESDEYFCNAAVYVHKPQKCFFKKEWFASSEEVRFDNESCAVPAGYDEILKTLYGDYMTPPPPEKRKGRHFGKILSKD